jgi:sensor histidine kinase YesM
LWFVLTPVILWLDARFKILSKHLVGRLFFHATCCVFVAFLHIVLYCAIVQFFGLSATPRTYFNRLQSQLKLFFHLDVICYWAVFAVNYAIDYYRRYREEELRSTRLEAKFAQTQLQMLKMQLHPHFLFNTLNAVSVLMTRDVRAAKKMLLSLSDLLRKSLEEAEAEEISLEQELEFLRHYLEIEQIRFQDRLTTKIEIEPQARRAQVPNLILQPLVENAIRHGIAARRAGGTIEIRARREEKSLCLSVRDDGGSGGKFDADKPVVDIKEGIGLSNTKARLKQLYGDDFAFRAEHIEGGFLVSIAIPFQIVRHSDSEAAAENCNAAVRRSTP